MNIAYSEKKENFSDKLYAGNKGVGRFSCDRLGSHLTLYTKSQTGDFIKLLIDWKNFENKRKNDQISDISVEYAVIDKKTLLFENKMDDFETGTILKITSLRDSWPANKLKKLISELEKFSPSLDDDFSIKIYSQNKDKDLIDKLNTKINNNILEKVSFKTTYIRSTIDELGRNIQTSLFYQGNEVYKYIVKNPYQNLKNISTEIHYIDTIARAYFTKKIGIKLVDYGSIFLFYNNFRISPYGNAKNDWLGIDQRKGQGRARYLGTRELFGRIDILDKENTFDVLTNREGLAQNKAFHELIAYEKEDKASISTFKEDDEDDENATAELESYGYITNIIRQLEAFVVDGLEWNKFIDIINPDSKKVISDRDLLKEPDRYKMKDISPEKIELVCDRLLKSTWNIKNLKINEDLIRHISAVAQNKHAEFLNDFLEHVGNKSISELSSKEKMSVKQIIAEANEKTNKAEKEKINADIKRIEAHKVVIEKTKEIAEKNKTIEQINSQNTFLKKTTNQDVEDLIVSMHSILVNTSTIRNNILSLLEIDGLSPDMTDLLSDINEANQKNFNIAKFATLYNFTDKENIINGELTLFIHEYLKEASSFRTNEKLTIEDKLNLNISINKEFIPLEIMMMLENIISNSRKAKAKSLTVYNSTDTEGNILFVFKDDGNGITHERYLKNPDLIFEKGETSTKGSGIGLYHLKKTMEKLNATVSILNHNNGFELGVKFK